MAILVTLATYEQTKTAYFLKENLENENIDCFLAFGYNTERQAEEVRIQVKEEDVERSIRIMMGIRDKYGKEIEELDPGDETRKIIVPTDFSVASQNACYYAIQMAEKLEAEIKVLHVYENPIDAEKVKKSATLQDYAQSAIRDREKKAKSEILAFMSMMKAFMAHQQIRDVKIHTTVVMGDIVGRIKEISGFYKPDTIVLGTVGRKEGSGSVLAGVANEIIRELEIPVYAIPGPGARKDFEQVNILYATDFNEKDHTSLNQLLKVVEPFQKSITCVHIDTAHNPSKKERMDELNIYLKKEYSEHNIQCRLIEDQDVFHGIKEFAEKNRINLLSFTTQKRGIFDKLFKPNLFKKILQESNLPILIFPS
jgi:nucleotide-binding universal stress UspA family protein